LAVFSESRSVLRAKDSIESLKIAIIFEIGDFAGFSDMKSIF